MPGKENHGKYRGHTGKHRGHPHTGQPQRERGGQGRDAGGQAQGFHNPYTFVPTPDRARVEAGTFSGDYDPSPDERMENHSRLWPGRYTGTIPLKLTVVTPLFITKTPEVREEANGHKVYDCLDYVPATALKGMLRSAYEAITNSRFGVFNEGDHSRRLGLRLPASASVVPGRVSKKSDGSWSVELFTGSSKIGENGKANGPLYAAWIPAHSSGHVSPFASVPPTGTRVNALLVECGHRHWDHGQEKLVNDNWTFWRVVSMSDSDQAPAPSTFPPDGPNSKWFYREEESSGKPKLHRYDGFVVNTGRTGVLPEK